MHTLAALCCAIYRLVLACAFAILELFRRVLDGLMVLNLFLKIHLPKIRKLVPEKHYAASARPSFLTTSYIVGVVTFLFSSVKYLRH